MLLGKKEVFMTNQADQYVKAKQALAEAGIKFDIKTFNTASQGRGDRNMLAGAVRRPELFYYVYVKKADEERARYVIREAFRR